MLFCYFKIIKIMRRSYFYSSCPKLRVDILIGNYWNFPINKRQYCAFANKTLVSFVVWVNHYSHISNQSLWPCRCYCNKFPTFYWKLYIIKNSFLFCIYYFQIRKTCSIERAIVNEPKISVNQPFMMHLFKCFINKFYNVRIKCIFLSRPIKRKSKFAKLVLNPSTMLFHIFPNHFVKRTLVKIQSGFSYLFQFFLKYKLCFNPCMICSRKPKNTVPFHPMISNKNVFHSKHRVAEMKRAISIGRRQNYRIRLSLGINFRFKIPFSLPLFIDFLLNVFVIINFIHLFP